MTSETVENYIKAVYTLARESPTGEAAMSRIAAAVGVTTGTATTMVKRLAHARFARYERFGGVTLTPRGERAALDILRRHRLVETFLVKTLKLDWSVVHDEAERLEHAISPLVLEALDRHLGSPVFDPHGDPIPTAEGRIAQRDLVPLDACPVGSVCRLSQTLDQREQSLRFLQKSRVEVGDTITIHSIEPGAGTIVLVNREGALVSISESAARRLLVTLRRTRAKRRHSAAFPTTDDSQFLQSRPDRRPGGTRTKSATRKKPTRKPDSG